MKVGHFYDTHLIIPYISLLYFHAQKSNQMLLDSNNQRPAKGHLVAMKCCVINNLFNFNENFPKSRLRLMIQRRVDFTRKQHLL